MNQLRERLKLSPLFLVVLTIVIEVTGGGLLFPVLPFLIEQYRSDATIITVLAASFATAQFFAAPILGSISDRVGRRPVLIVCTLGTSLSFFLFGMADALWIMFLAQIANGITGGVVSTAQAYMADIASSPQERTKNFGLIGASAGIGFILGPLVGGVLGGISLRLPFFIAGAIAAANSLCTFLLLPESLKEPNPEPISPKEFIPFRQLLELLRRPQLFSLMFGYFAFFMAFAGFTNIFVVLVKNRYEWGPMDAAAILFFVGIVASAVQGGLIRKLLPRFGELSLTLTGFLMVSLALCLVAIAPRGYYLYGTQAIFAFGVGIAAPSLRGLIANSVPDNEQGKVSGGSQSLSSLTQVMGPLLAGYAYDRLAPAAPMWIGAVLVVVAVVAIASGPTASAQRAAKMSAQKPVQKAVPSLSEG